MLELGTDAQQPGRCCRRYAGDQLRAPARAAVIEPRFNFDLHALHTTATRENGDFVLNGTKCYVPLAAEAEHILVYARGERGLDGVPRAARRAPG